MHTGTLPSKTLRETALFLSGYRQRELYGITVTSIPTLAVPKLISRKDAVREPRGRRASAEPRPPRGRATSAGTARFVDAHTVEVIADRRRRGALHRRVHPGRDGLGALPPGRHPVRRLRTSTTATRSCGIDRAARRSLTVIGGGVIGCEYASMFAALGVESRWSNARPGCCRSSTRRWASAARARWRALGVRLALGARRMEARRAAGDGLAVHADVGRQSSSSRDRCSSRRPARQHRRARPRGRGRRRSTSAGYVAVDEHYRTAVPSIYAAGDVIGFPALASTSMEQARVAVCHAFGFDYKRQVVRAPAVRHLHDPRGELRRARRGRTRRRGASTSWSAGRSTATTRAARSSATRDGLVKLVFERATRKLIGVPLHRRARDRAGPHRPGGDHARRHGRHVHRDGVQLPDARRVLQVRRVRRAWHSSPPPSLCDAAPGLRRMSVVLASLRTWQVRACRQSASFAFEGCDALAGRAAPPCRSARF